MHALVTGEQMQRIDEKTIQEIGIPSLVLMERAALAVAEEVKKRAGRKDRILVACGGGNNGADGIAAARMLHLWGYDTVAVFLGDREKAGEQLNTQLRIAENLGVEVIDYEDYLPGDCDIVIDAVFGVGLSRAVEGRYREFLDFLQQAGQRLTVAVDLPSGIGSTSGHVLGTALKADVTVTFGWKKLGCSLFPGREYAGKVVVADIGFPEQLLKEAQSGGPDCITYDPKDLSQIPQRRPDAHKGSFGKVLIAAGSANMGGAALFSALAAYRTGAGLVKILTVEENRSFLLSRLPEAILDTYLEEDMEEPDASLIRRIEEDCEWADAVVLGPGIGQTEAALSLTRQILTAACSPLILDADALNIISANPDLTGYFTENIILTPHVGEMSRLSGMTAEEIKHKPLQTAGNYAGHYGITCVLKDAATIVALKDGRFYINESGNSAMSKGGSGDVLTGIIAGLLAQGMEENEAAAVGVYLHGLAGDLGKEKYGSYGLLAHELADCAGLVLKGLGEENELS